MSDDLGPFSPPPPPDPILSSKSDELRYSAELDDYVAGRAEFRHRVTIQLEATNALRLDATRADIDAASRFCDFLLGNAISSIQRSRVTAQFVQVSASAIATALTAILALAFSAKDRPLPLVAVTPTLFLALAIVAATFYGGFLTQSKEISVPLVPTSTIPAMHARVEIALRLANAYIENRIYALRFAVMSMAAAVVTLPLVLILPSLSLLEVGGIAGSLLLVVLITPAVAARFMATAE